MADIDRVHVAGYADRIFAAAERRGMLDADTYVVAGPARRRCTPPAPPSRR